MAFSHWVNWLYFLEYWTNAAHDFLEGITDLRKVPGDQAHTREIQEIQEKYKYLQQLSVINNNLPNVSYVSFYVSFVTRSVW